MLGRRRDYPYWKRLATRAYDYFCPYQLYTFKWWFSIFSLFVLILACVSLYLRLTVEVPKFTQTSIPIPPPTLITNSTKEKLQDINTLKT